MNTSLVRINTQINFRALETYVFCFNREELVNIKAGEEEKQKFYRALCVLKTSVTAEHIKMLNIPNGFLVQQKTPLRVLHRRPLLTRPRQIFSVKAYACKGKLTKHIIVLTCSES